MKILVVLVILNLFFLQEAHVSGRIVPVALEEAAAESEIIVIGEPFGNPSTKRIDFEGKEGGSYNWTIQAYKIIEVLKNNDSSSVSEGEIISVSSYDGNRYNIANRYSQGVRKIAIYREYKSKSQAKLGEGSKRVLFLRKESSSEIENLYIYAVSRGFDGVGVRDNIPGVPSPTFWKKLKAIFN